MIGVNSMVSKKVEGVKGKEEKEAVLKKRDVAKESKGATGSWSAVVQSNPKMKKSEYTIRDVDGVPTIRVPKEIIKKSTPLWEDMLVGRFQSTAPYMEEDAQPEVKTMPVWVVVKNVPRYMYAWEGFAFMTSPIGEPIRLHPETEIGGGNVLVTFEYPWLPPRCHQCSKWGHNIDDCLKKREVTSVSPTKSPKKVADASKTIVEKSSQVTKPVLDEVEQGNNDFQVQVNSGSKEKDQTIDPKKGVDGDQEEGWNTPPNSMKSPRKVTKSLKYGDVRIESSCFSALNGKGEDGECGTP
ncbi:hypothetical protein Tco_0010636 [Tanacetum coccineum]